MQNVYACVPFHVAKKLKICHGKISCVEYLVDWKGNLSDLQIF